MPNVGVLTSKMHGLWHKEQFWELLGADRIEVRKELEEQGFAKILVPNKRYLDVLRKYVTETRLREIFNEDFLTGTKPDFCIFCVLRKGHRTPD